jgi:hypothetical protein
MRKLLTKSNTGLKLLLFCFTMLLLSSICNGQGKTSFGDNAVNDTSFTVAQLKLNAYGGSGDTMILIVLPNGDVKKVAKNHFGSTYTGGYGIDVTGTVISLDTVEVDARYLRLRDTAAMLDPYLRIYAPTENATLNSLTVGSINSGSIINSSTFMLEGIGTLEEKILTIDPDGDVNKSAISTNDVLVWADTSTSPGIATQYDLSQVSNSISNASIEKSSTPTTLAPTQAAARGYTDLAATTALGTPYVHCG